MAESRKRPSVQRNARVGSQGARLRGWARSALSSLQILSGLLLVAGVSAGVVWGAHRYALTTSNFALEHFDPQGLRHLTPQQVQEQSGLRLGDNLFAIDLEEVEGKLLADPFIAEVHLTRQLPHTLRLDVVERIPTAVATISGRLFLLSQHGEPFKEVAPDDSLDLPVVSGVGADDVARNRVAALERLRTALDLLQQYNELAISKSYPAQEAQLVSDGARLVVGNAGISLELGEGPWRKKLAMAERVLGKLRGQGGAPGLVFLDNRAHPERVVVRMK